MTVADILLLCIAVLESWI